MGMIILKIKLTGICKMYYVLACDRTHGLPPFPSLPSFSVAVSGADGAQMPGIREGLSGFTSS